MSSGKKEIAVEDIYQILETVKDPEIPVISILDLGMVNEVVVNEDEVEVKITPTYSGCPAMDVIPLLIEQALHSGGYQKVKVKNILFPPWTTDWISEAGKAKLKAFGIAPPQQKTTDQSFLDLEDKEIGCPRCNSVNTAMVSRFGSTPCKAAYQCKDCHEPFDYFKCH